MAIARRSLLTALSLPVAARADDDPVLEVRGSIAPPVPRRLTLSQLEAIGRVELVTRTPWTVGLQRFSGLPLDRLLEAVGAQGQSLRAVALNDYAVTMPVAEAVDAGAFLATHQDGAPMPVRLRGPVWIIFPWSQRADLDTATNRQRSIWQVRLMVID
jgi:hypothetical protein